MHIKQRVSVKLGFGKNRHILIIIIKQRPADISPIIKALCQMLFFHASVFSTGNLFRFSPISMFDYASTKLQDVIKRHRQQMKLFVIENFRLTSVCWIIINLLLNCDCITDLKGDDSNPQQFQYNSK